MLLTLPFCFHEQIGARSLVTYLNFIEFQNCFSENLFNTRIYADVNEGRPVTPDGQRNPANARSTSSRGRHTARRSRPYRPSSTRRSANAPPHFHAYAPGDLNGILCQRGNSSQGGCPLQAANFIYDQQSVHSVNNITHNNVVENNSNNNNNNNNNDNDNDNDNNNDNIAVSRTESSPSSSLLFQSTPTTSINEIRPLTSSASSERWESEPSSEIRARGPREVYCRGEWIHFAPIDQRQHVAIRANRHGRGIDLVTQTYTPTDRQTINAAPVARISPCSRSASTPDSSNETDNDAESLSYDSDATTFYPQINLSID